jgi:hypothetical protein
MAFSITLFRSLSLFILCLSLPLFVSPFSLFTLSLSLSLLLSARLQHSESRKIQSRAIYEGRHLGNITLAKPPWHAKQSKVAGDWKAANSATLACQAKQSKAKLSKPSCWQFKSCKDRNFAMPSQAKPSQAAGKSKAAKTRWVYSSSLKPLCFVVGDLSESCIWLWD